MFLWLRRQIFFLCMSSHPDSFLFCGPQAQGYSWNDAYGKFLGTNMVCSFATTLISFLPPRVLRKLFPTWIAGLTVFLVGVTLIGVAGISVGTLYAYTCMHPQLCQLTCLLLSVAVMKPLGIEFLV